MGITYNISISDAYYSQGLLVLLSGHYFQLKIPSVIWQKRKGLFI